MAYDDLRFLSVPLPEDIRKLKGMGDYARLDRVLALRLRDDKLPQALRKRLELERRIIERIPAAYPYTLEEGAAMLAGEIEGFTRQELDMAIDENKVEWAFIDGEIRLHTLFLSTLIKTRPELEPRVIHPEKLSYKKQNFAILDDIIAQMKRDGGAARRWHVRHTLSIKPEYRRPGEEVLVHLPLPVEYDCVKHFKLIDAGPVPGQVADARAPQRTISFRKPLEADDVFFAEYSFEVHMPYHDLDPALATGGHPADDGEDYLGEQPPHIAFTPLVRAVAEEIAGDEKNPLLLARRVYDFLTTKPIYSYVRSYFTYPNLVEHMLTAMKGDCGIFALCFITLCRALGIPARWQSGLYCAPHDVGCHDWAQFWCEPWGWLPVDGSFGNAA